MAALNEVAEPVVKPCRQALTCSEVDRRSSQPVAVGKDLQSQPWHDLRQGQDSCKIHYFSIQFKPGKPEHEVEITASLPNLSSSSQKHAPEASLASIRRSSHSEDLCNSSLPKPARSTRPTPARWSATCAVTSPRLGSEDATKASKVCGALCQTRDCPNLSFKETS